MFVCFFSQSHFNGGLTKTTATLTPTRLKNIEEQFLEHSLLPSKPFLHDHMAGFVPPTVNIKLHLQSQHQQIQSDTAISVLNDQDSQPPSQQQQQSSKSIDYFSSNSNSNDSFSTNYISDGYSSETNSSCQANVNNFTFTNFIQNSNSMTTKMPSNPKSSSKSRSKSASNNNAICLTTRSTRSSQKKSTSGGRKPNSSQNV